MNIKLRDYQTPILESTRQSFRKGNKRTLVVLPCGAGKTVIFAQMAALSQEKGKKVLFLVHRRELLKQTEDTFKRFNIPPVDILTVQGFVRRLDDTPYDFIIFDEAHHSTSNTWQKIINHYKNAFMVGLTATPCRLDGKPLGAIYSDMIVGVTANELIDRGYLSDYKYYAPTLADLTGLKVRGADFDMGNASELLDKPKIYGDIIETYNKLAQGRKSICYCPTVAFSEKIADIFQEAGINAVHFDGTTNAKKRDSIIEQFRQGEIQVLCNVDLISEGFDVPDCDCAILLRPTKSLALYTQQACRPLRPCEGKEYAIIIDHVGNYTRFGFPTDDREWSLKSPIKEIKNETKTGQYAVRVCEVCFRTFKTAPVCPYCGHEYEPDERELEQMKEVQLQEIKRAKQRSVDFYRERAREIVKKYSEWSECRNMMELSEWCKQEGYDYRTFRYLAIMSGFIQTR